MVMCPVAYRLCRGVDIVIHHEVGPDFIGDDSAVVSLVNLHRLCDLVTGPDAATGIMRVAEDRDVDMVLLDLTVHVVVVHAPGAIRFPKKRRMDDPVAIGR